MAYEVRTYDYGYLKYTLRLIYNVATDNDTTYSLTVQGIVDVKNNTDERRHQSTAIALSGSGQTTKRASGYSYISAHSQKTIEILPITWSWSKEHSAVSKSIRLELTQTESGDTGGVSHVFTVPVKTSYAISYNANGGSGAPGGQTKWYNEPLKLQTGVPTKSGYTFLGWSTSNTATSAAYKAGDTYSANSGASLYAIWRKTITLTYDANGGSGAPSSQTGYAYNSNTSVSLTISSTKPTKTGYTCIGWSTSSTATTSSYNFNTAYSFSANTKLYAVWKANQYSISYNNNGGSGTITAQTKTYDSALTLSNGSGFSRTGTVNGVGVEYELLRWNTKADGTGTNYALSGSAPNITQNLTLYAVWSVKYVYPTISNLTVKRTATSSASDTTEADDGEYFLITFDWTACSEDGGTTAITPACQITIGSHQYTPTLTSNFSFKPTDVFSQDESFEVTVLLYDAGHTTARASTRATVPTAILPIDMYGDNNGVYMGIMHKYESGQTLTLPSTYIDGDIILEIDPNDATTSDAALYTALHNMGWI